MSNSPCAADIRRDGNAAFQRALNAVHAAALHAEFGNDASALARCDDARRALDEADAAIRKLMALWGANGAGPT